MVSPKAPEVRANLALIGGRGCGKSSIAKRLLRQNRGFLLFSLDALIRYEADGVEIPQIVEAEGWAHFRELEYRVLQRVTRFRSGALLDCGGGVVVDLDDAGEEQLSDRKVKLLRENARVVYLARDIEYLEGRIANDPGRPSLSDAHSFREIVERRDPWYRAAAHWTLDCGDLSKVELSDQILEWFYRETGVTPSRN